MNPASPFSLPLAPMPRGHMETSGEQRFPLPDGFVDDEVIASLLSVPSASRYVAPQTDLVLSSDENDFAGWTVPCHSPFRFIADTQERAATPESAEAQLTEPGLGYPH